MISKELLSEVLGVFISSIITDIETVKQITKSNSSDNYIAYTIEDIIGWHTINIHELAHKCKEWAYKRGFLYWYENSRLFIKIMHSCKVDFVIDIGEYKKPFEIDIDFKACQWILDNKES